jgi:hypothetical protein
LRVLNKSYPTKEKTSRISWLKGKVELRSNFYRKAYYK